MPDSSLSLSVAVMGFAKALPFGVLGPYYFKKENSFNFRLIFFLSALIFLYVSSSSSIAESLESNNLFLMAIELFLSSLSVLFLVQYVFFTLQPLSHLTAQLFGQSYAMSEAEERLLTTLLLIVFFSSGGHFYVLKHLSQVEPILFSADGLGSFFSLMITAFRSWLILLIKISIPFFVLALCREFFVVLCGAFSKQFIVPIKAKIPFLILYIFTFFFLSFFLIGFFSEYAMDQVLWFLQERGAF